MERHPEDIAADPLLREEFVQQESWDEYVERQLDEIAETDPVLAQEVRENTAHPVYQYWNYVWMEELHPKTRTAEVFYLKGHTDRDERHSAAAQFHSTLREAAIKQGWYPADHWEVPGLMVEDMEQKLHKIVKENQEGER